VVALSFVKHSTIEISNKGAFFPDSSKGLFPYVSKDYNGSNPLAMRIIHLGHSSNAKVRKRVSEAGQGAPSKSVTSLDILFKENPISFVSKLSKNWL